MRNSKPASLIAAASVLILFLGFGAAAARGISDKKFVEKAATGGMMEITLGEMASKQGLANDVKEFGRKMVNDHSMAQQRLTALAEQDNIKLPADMDRKEGKMVNHLSMLTGHDFDRAYMKHMVQDHQKDVELFRKMAKDGRNPELRNFAQEQLPILQDHLRIAEDINRTVQAKG